MQTDHDKASQRMSQKDLHDANRASEVFDNSPDLHDAQEDIENVMKFKDLNNTKLKITDDLVAQMVPLWRDKQDSFSLMEHMFGSIEGGCAFGQTCFGTFKEPKKRFYSAVTI